MKNLSVLLFCCFVISNSFAQSKKDIAKNNILSETATVTKIEDGKEITFKDTYTVYDKDGKVIEETNYNKEGAVKDKKSYKYDAQKNKIEESDFEGKSNETKKTTYTYNANNDKVSEIEYDASGNIKKQITYTYDSNGFKKDKKTYDANKKLISIKKYTYTPRK